jgi:hypothetical protein
VSPLVVIYSETKILVQGEPEWDTFKIFHSGFPIPYVTQNNLSWGSLRVNPLIAYADIVIVMLTLMLVWEGVRRWKQGKRARQTHE